MDPLESQKLAPNTPAPNNSSHKRVVVGVVILVLLIAVSAYGFYRKYSIQKNDSPTLPVTEVAFTSTVSPEPATVPVTVVATSTATSSQNVNKPAVTASSTAQVPVNQKPAVAPSPATNAPISTLVLDTKAYTNTEEHFSLTLPKGWKAFEQGKTSAGNSIVFYDSTKTADDHGTDILFSRSDLDAPTREEISAVGEADYVNYLISQIQAQYKDFVTTGTKKVLINGRIFYEVRGTYVGSDSGKSVVLITFISLTTDTMYAITVSGYQDVFAGQKDVLLTSISTLKI